MTCGKASEFLFIAGQVAVDKSGRPVGVDDFDAQCAAMQKVVAGGLAKRLGRVVVRMRTSFALLAILLGAGVQPAGSATGWDRYVEPRLGTSIDYPIGIFSVDEGATPGGTGREFKKDGNAALAPNNRLREGHSHVLRHLGRARTRQRKPHSSCERRSICPRPRLGTTRTKPSHPATQIVARCGLDRGAPISSPGDARGR
jgi:hypothetical protein